MAKQNSKSCKHITNFFSKPKAHASVNSEVNEIRVLCRFLTLFKKACKYFKLPKNHLNKQNMKVN